MNNTERLQEQLTGCRQIIRLDAAVLAAVLDKTGPVEVRQMEIRRNLRDQRQVLAACDPQGGIYRLWTEGGGTDAGN